MFSNAQNLDFSQREYERMRHLETFAVETKTIAELPPRFFGQKRYVVAVLKKEKAKKGKQGKEYFQPVYQSPSLDSAKFAYDNVHVQDLWTMCISRKRKELLNITRIDTNQNRTKVLLLEKDLEEQENKRVTIAMGKEFGDMDKKSKFGIVIIPEEPERGFTESEMQDFLKGEL